MRWGQHFFENSADMTFNDGQHHLDESRERRLANIRQQTSRDVMSEELYADDGLNQQFKANTVPPVYLSHNYYTQRWDSFDSNRQGVATAQNGFYHEDFKNMPPSEEVDLTKEQIRSNKIKMGLAQFGTREEQSVLRQSSLMSLAFGWTPSVELPIAEIEQNENEQIIENFFAKMTKSHFIDNFLYFDELQKSQPSAKAESYHTSFYAADHPLHPVSQPGGILQGITPQDITKLPKSHRAYKLFHQQMMLHPTSVLFLQISILQPEQRKVTVTNTHQAENLVIDNILTCSPEVFVQLPRNVYYPVVLKPGQNVTVSVVVAPETWGLLQTAVIVSFRHMINLMVPVTAFHVQNEYELEPVYFTNVNIGEQVQGQIRIKNPSADDELEILEVYSSEDYLKLYWPNSVQLASSGESQSNRDFSKYLKIEAGAKAKTILNYKFETDQLVDHRAVVHMVTSRGDVLRIPIYFHIYPDLLKFTPSIVDFGIVPFKFDALRVPVSVTIRNGYNIGMLYLNDVLVPVSENRLDFVMGRWCQETYGNIQVYNKKTGRLEEHKRAVLHKDRLLDLFTVVLNPLSFGEIDTAVILIFATEEGQEYRVDLPIVGHVLRQNNLLVEDVTGSGAPTFAPWSKAVPAVTLNVKNFLADQTTTSQTGQLLKSKKIEERLIIFNNLSVNLKGIEVINLFPEAEFAYQSGSSSTQLTSTKNAVLGQGQSIQLGSLFFNLKDLKTTAGHYHFFLMVNQNLFLPMVAQVTDNNLICSYRPNEFGPDRLVDCQSGINLEFKKIALHHPRYKTFNITNIGSEPVQIDWISTTGENEIEVTFKSLDPPLVEGAPQFPLVTFRGVSIDHKMRRVGSWIQPFQTVVIQIGLETFPYSVRTGQSSRIVTFQFSPNTYRALSVNVTFFGQHGTANFLPDKPVLSFNPSFFGASDLQTQSITLQSGFESPIHVKTITVDNPHFKVTTVNSKLRNGSEAFQVTFDPNTHQQAESIGLSLKSKQDHRVVLQRSNQEAAVQQSNARSRRDNQTGAEAKFSETDIAQYREIQESLFAKRRKTESQAVSGVLEIETDQLSKATYRLEGEIIKPQIMLETSIDFGKRQIGTAESRHLTIKNPYAEPLLVQLAVGRQTAEIESELKRLKLIASSQINRALSQDESYGLILDKVLQKLNFTRFYCKDKMSPDKQIEFNWWAEGNYYDEEPIALTKTSDSDIICYQVSNLLQSYDSYASFERDWWFWSQVEHYFRQLIVEGIKVHTTNDSSGKVDTFDFFKQLDTLVDRIIEAQDEESENRVQSVDTLILQDLLWCTEQRQVTLNNFTLPAHLRDNLAFPNVFDYYFPVRPVLEEAARAVLSPFARVFTVLAEGVEKESLSYMVVTLVSDLYELASSLSRSLLSHKGGPLRLRPEDYIQAKRREASFLPAATTTNSLTFRDETLHSLLVKNNGTTGVERNTQGFFLNPQFREPLIVKPLESVVLKNAISFEPHALVASEVKHQMLLFIKTNQTSLQTIPLSGSTGSGVIDLYRVDKMSGDTLIRQQSRGLPAGRVCRYMHEHLVHDVYPLCQKQISTSQFVQQQIFGKSTLAYQVELFVNLADMVDQNTTRGLNFQQQEQQNKSFLSRVESFASNVMSCFFSSSRDSDDDMQAQPPTQIEWLLTFHNVGNHEYQVNRFGFEDPKTGEISCRSGEDGELVFMPCSLQIATDTVQPEDQILLRLRYNIDYSKVSLRRTIVFESQSHWQRFPLAIEIDPEVIQYRLSYQTGGYCVSIRFKIAILLIAVTQVCAVNMYFAKIKRQAEMPSVVPGKNEPAQDEQAQALMEFKLNSAVTSQYQQVQDRFKANNTQFIRELANLGKRQNSAFQDYQKSFIQTRKPTSTATQITNIARSRPSRHQATAQQQPERLTTEEVVETSAERQPTIAEVDDTPQHYEPIVKPPIVVEDDTKQASPKIVPTQATLPDTPTPTLRLNKKERRAMEQRRKEAELAILTQNELEKGSRQQQAAIPDEDTFKDQTPTKPSPTIEKVEEDSPRPVDSQAAASADEQSAGKDHQTARQPQSQQLTSGCSEQQPVRRNSTQSSASSTQKKPVESKVEQYRQRPSKQAQPSAREQWSRGSATRKPREQLSRPSKYERKPSPPQRDPSNSARGNPINSNLQPSKPSILTFTEKREDSELKKTPAVPQQQQQRYQRTAAVSRTTPQPGSSQQEDWRSERQHAYYRNKQAEEFGSYYRNKQHYYSEVEEGDDEYTIPPKRLYTPVTSQFQRASKFAQHHQPKRQYYRQDDSLSENEEYWRPAKANSSSSFQLKPSVPIEEPSPFEETKDSPPRSTSPEQIQQQRDQDEPVSNYFNAFQSIREMFNQKTKLIKTASTDGHQRDEESDDPLGAANKLSLNQLFAGQNAADGDRSDPDSPRNQPQQPSKFSLFGDSIWRTDESRFQRPVASTLYQPPKRTYYQQHSDQQRMNLVQFAPLRQYNTMFSESLNQLTSSHQLTQHQSARGADQPANSSNNSNKQHNKQYKLF